MFRVPPHSIRELERSIGALADAHEDDKLSDKAERFDPPTRLDAGWSLKDAMECDLAHLARTGEFRRTKKDAA